jgi:Lsr2
MAQEITGTLQDDLDGGPAGQIVRFGLDGAADEIDLSASNATVFRERLAPYPARESCADLPG